MRGRETKKKTPKKKRILLVIFSVVVIGFSLASRRALLSGESTTATLEGNEMIQTTSGEMVDAASIKKHLKELKTHGQMPEETPQIIMLDENFDVSTSQAFYQNALAGDIVLLYPGALVAVIYRPGEHRIVNQGPIVITDSEQEDETSPSVKEVAGGTEDEAPNKTLGKVTVHVRNGNGASGAAGIMQKALRTLGFLVPVAEDAAHDDYESSHVVVLNSEITTTDPLIESIAIEIKGKVSVTDALPEGE